MIKKEDLKKLAEGPLSMEISASLADYRELERNSAWLDIQRILADREVLMTQLLRDLDNSRDFDQQLKGALAELEFVRTLSERCRELLVIEKEEQKNE